MDLFWSPFRVNNRRFVGSRDFRGALRLFEPFRVVARGGSLQKAQVDIGRWMTLASLTFRNWRFLIVMGDTNSSTIPLKNAQSTTLLSRSASTRSVDAFVSNFSNLRQKCLSEATAGRPWTAGQSAVDGPDSMTSSYNQTVSCRNEAMNDCDRSGMSSNDCGH
jgi:hypothetical protein